MELEKCGHLHITNGLVERTTTLQNSLTIPYKVKYTFTYDAAITCLSIYPIEMKAYVTQIFTQNFVIAIIHNN